ncbi:sulfate ABC transporter substrate-binding protein [Neobacillus cucumis]|uniref:sulfate ABC transporter substrate-binding protein n=1 Tax=Neobacillus cucumis TaxID=1740721 RepID=UPI0019646570|nr:sulfate ABC transporter substrate-binding protein [Neobacillus cucumis]MBM7650933.1 sulfate transport system substrate-binding protein [Neobacillus cucumis]
MKKVSLISTAILLSASVALSGCSNSSSKSEKSGGSTSSTSTNETVTLTIGGYSTIKDEFEAIFPLFQKEWKKETGQTVVFKESYQGSGSQALNITNGFEADIAALSLEGDIDKIVKAGLITHDWKSAPHNGIITDSIAAFGVREGNPKNIKDWSDLTKSGVQVVFPNPKTSGGARWDVNAIYGAGLKISEEQSGKQDPAQAKALLSKIYKNVKSLDKSGEESMSTFDKGTGDIIITYENELLDRINSGSKYEEVIPKYTTSIENPAAVVDKYVDKHGTRKVAEAFLNFLWTPEAQKVFAESGFRSVDADVAKAYADKFKQPEGLFDTSYLGGWTKVGEDLYGDGGIWDQVVAGK